MGDEETSVGAPLAVDTKAEEATAVEATEAQTSGRGMITIKVPVAAREV